MAVRIGITGGIGSGKSVVSRILQSMGIPVYDCDTEARRIMGGDPVVHDRLVEHFGEQCYSAAYGLDRKYLAGCIFGNAENLRLVNSIVHPRVKDDFLGWCSNAQVPVVAVESAILFESGFADTVDIIVCVYADREVCITRACRRSSISREDVEQRIAKQLPVSNLIEKSDYSICNNPGTPLLPQIDNLLKKVGGIVGK